MDQEQSSITLASDTVLLSEVRNPPSAELVRAAATARDYVAHAKAANTLKAYRLDWRDFSGWCDEHGRQALPASPETVALYLSVRAATCKPSTLQRRLSAISQAHRAAGHDSPTKTLHVQAVWAGIRRVHGTAEDGAAAAIIEDLRAMVETLDDTLIGTRDRALLVLWFATGARRSEVVAWDREDVELVREGLIVTTRRSKTDQEGKGKQKGVPYGSNPDTCPVRSLQDWLQASGVTTGPLFRAVDRHGNLSPRRMADRSASEVVKRCAAAAGLSAEKYSGHSMRAGFVTSAAEAGVSEAEIMEQTGHRSATVLRKYIRRGTLFKNNVAAKVGL